jgi:hypothetical protein
LICPAFSNPFLISYLLQGCTKASKQKLLQGQAYETAGLSDETENLQQNKCATKNYCKDMLHLQKSESLYLDSAVDRMCTCIVSAQFREAPFD